MQIPFKVGSKVKITLLIGILLLGLYFLITSLASRTEDLGYQAFYAGNYAEAENLFSRRILLSIPVIPRKAEWKGRLYALLAASQLELGKLDEASESLKKASSMIHDDFVEVPKSRPIVDPTIKLNFHIMWGRIYLSKLELEKAEEELREAIKLNPDDGEAYLHLARTIRQKEVGSAEAVAAGRKATELLPENNFAWRVLALAYRDSGGYAEGLKAADEAIQLNQNACSSYNVKASILFGLSRYDEALQELDRAIELAPGSIESYVCLVEGYTRKGEILERQGKVLEAVQHYELALGVKFQTESDLQTQSLKDYQEKSSRRIQELK